MYIALIWKNKYLYFIWKKRYTNISGYIFFFQACRSFVQPSRSSRWRNFGTIPRGPILFHCSRTEVIKELKIQTAGLLLNFNKKMSMKSSLKKYWETFTQFLNENHLKMCLRLVIVLNEWIEMIYKKHSNFLIFFKNHRRNGSKEESFMNILW